MSQPLGLVALTNDEYHRGPGISKSHLDVMAQGPLKYWQAYVNPERPRREPTPAMVVGTAIHAAILEPDLFELDFAAAPDVDRRTKAGKEEYAEWFAANEGKTALTRDQYDVACGARDAVWRNERARKLLEHGAAEQSYFALDGEHGELVKCRTDWDTQRGCIVDVKSTDDASPEGFIRSVIKWRYHVQVAWYRDVIEAATDAPAPPDWIFLAVEKTPPFAVGLYRVTEPMVHAGRVLAREDLRRILQCRAANHWPDYNAGEIAELEPPGWLAKRLGLNSPEMDFA